MLFGAMILNQIHSTYFILAILVGLAAFGGILKTVGFADWAGDAFARIVQAIIGTGFRLWERTLSWGGWMGLLALSTLLLSVSIWCISEGWAPLALPASILLIAAGGSTCLAYMYISVERYEVGRGFKALHNPEKGQSLAVDLVRYGSRFGVPMLGSATAITLLGFALLNQALHESGGRGWYRLGDPDAHPVYLDFLAYTILHLLKIVDVFDLAQSYEFLSVSLIRPAKFPASILMTGFKSFFTLVLLQQVFASVRQGRLLSNTVSDFWSPHVPIRDRARSVLPQFGPDAIAPVLVTLRSAVALTQEQREQLPTVLAGIGPAAIPSLLRHLHDRHDTNRAVTAAALGLLGVRAAIPALGKLVRDPSEIVRLSVVEALGRIGESLTARGARTEAEGPATSRKRWWRRAAAWARRPRSRTEGVRPGHNLEHVVAVLLEAFDDPSTTVRTRAAIAAGRVGPAAAVTARPLAVLLGNEADDVRTHSAQALGRIRAEDPGIVEALIAALADPTPAVRIAVVSALGEYGGAAAPSVTALVGLLADGSDDVRMAVADAIARIGVRDDHSARLLSDGLASADNIVRAQTAESLGRMGSAAESAAPALVEALTDANDRVRAKAAEALGRIGEGAAAAAVPGLMRLLRDEDNWVRALAAEALGEMGSAAEDAAPALLRSLRHANPQVRGRAAESLGKLRSADSRAALESACGDPDSAVRAKALRALGNLEALAPSTERTIETAAIDSDPEVRAMAADVMAERAEEWPGAAGTVVGLISDGNDAVAIRALLALQRFAVYPPGAADAVIALLRGSGDTWIQSAAAMTLSRMGALGLPAGAELAAIASTGDAELRQAALRALAILQPEEAAGAFVAGLRDAEADVRKIAAAGLQKAGRIPDDGLETVVEALLDPDGRVRTTICAVVGRLDPVPAEAIPHLIENVSAEYDDPVRLSAAIALREAGPAVPNGVMFGLLGDANVRVRLTAAGALFATDPSSESVGSAIREALVDSNPRIRTIALEILESVDGAAGAFRADVEGLRLTERDSALRERLDGLIGRWLPSPGERDENTPAIPLQEAL